MAFKIGGVLPAMLTPFKRGGLTVDYDRAGELALYLAKKGVHGLFVAGTTGEGLLLRMDERKKLLEAVVDAVGKKLDVVAQSGALDTPASIELTRHAADIGAKAAGIVSPGFYRYDEPSLENHYRNIARAVPGFPIMLYDIPGTSKNPLGPKLILKLANEVENIVGVKDSGGRMQKLNEILAGAPKGFIVINGVDEYTFQARIAGAHGSVASTANVVPELFLEINKHVDAGKFDSAWNSQKKLGRVCAMFRYGAMVAVYKEAMRLRGFDPGYVRGPQRELTKKEKRELAEGMKDAGLI
jgi:dihydrodipicolinate synthase/N-acetylneuraminate lyase